MAKIYRNWYELDDDFGAYEYCRGRGTKCGCAGSETQCEHLEYFNQPKGVCEKLRAKFSEREARQIYREEMEFELLEGEKIVS